MAKAGQGKAQEKLEGKLDVLTASLPREKGPRPVDRWNPPFCGDIDMRIDVNGIWYYQGSPIGRLPLVKLFASVLKREGEKYFLVTPVEKVGMIVEDAPFLAVELKVAHNDIQVLTFRTNMDEWVDAGPGHPLRFEPEPETGGLRPYLHIRRDLWAKVTRALYYDLVGLGEERIVDGNLKFGLASGDEFYVMADACTSREQA